MEIKEKNSAEYYDSFSNDYHLIFNDWNEVIKKQAIVLNNLIKKYSKYPIETILDCSCGIGTQTLGLASLNYSITGADLSKNAIK
ncbi:MAG: glycine/sarcosine N-methyltransferase [Flavobacterium sp.]|jgi:glycine/sarcosine N-methyltransferase